MDAFFIDSKDAKKCPDNEQKQITYPCIFSS